MSDKLEEVYPRIFKIVEHTRRRIAPPVNLYIIPGQDGLLFDGGYGDASSIAQVGSALKHIKKMFASSATVNRVLPSHTHPDHFSGLKQLHDTYGFNVMLTSAMASVISSRQAYRASFMQDKEYEHRYSSIIERLMDVPMRPIFAHIYKKIYGMEFIDRPDCILQHGDTITTGSFSWKVLYGPGHCDDHIMLYCEKEGILLAGDNILRSIYTWLGPPRSNLQAYLDTLESCYALPNLKLILSAHGSPITNPQKRIREIIEYRKLRARQVFSLIANADSKGITFQKLLDILYPRRYSHRWLAKGWVIVTIEYLLQKNVIAFEGKQMLALSSNLTF